MVSVDVVYAKMDGVLTGVMIFEVVVQVVVYLGWQCRYVVVAPGESCQSAAEIGRVLLVTVLNKQSSLMDHGRRLTREMARWKIVTRTNIEKHLLFSSCCQDARYTYPRVSIQPLY